MSKVLPSAWNVPEVIRARFGKEAGQQRAMLHDGHLVLVTHLVPVTSEIARKAALFWRSPDGAWRAAGEARGNISALTDLVESYKTRAAQLEGQLDHAVKASDYFAILSAVAPFLRAARNLHKTLQDAREKVPADHALIALRDTASEAERTADIVATDARSGLDFVTARQAEAQATLSDHIARSSHKLNLVVALFLPITALGSMLGMNLVHGFETRGAPFTFYAAVVFSFVVGFILRAAINRREAT